MYLLDLSLIERASSFLKGLVRRTPIEFSPYLSEHAQVPIYLKLECLQLTGSFKIRGGFFYLSTLTADEKKRGVACCSAGNHGLGVAYAAKEMKIPCTVYVPKSVDKAKYEKLLKLGAHVIKSEFLGYDDTLEWAEIEAKKHHLHFISAFDEERIMAANGGTIATEIYEDLPDAENFIIPTGGGGLMAGFSYYMKAKNPTSRMIACQHEHSCALKVSLEKGEAVTKVPGIETVAGGIEGGLGKNCFKYIKDRVKDVALLSEEEIIEGFRFLLKHHQYLVEPSASIAVSACLFNKIADLNGPTVIVLTGRNVSYATIAKLI